MGIFLVQNFKKDSKGNWVETSKKIDKAPHDVGRWNRSRDLDETYVVTATTRGGLSQKVVRTTTYFDKGREKVNYKLITTSNKLSKVVKEKYANVKNSKCF